MSDQNSYRRIRLSLPLEGVAFAVLLSFVTVCSILRSVNMLVVVSGMMFAAILLSWRLSRSAVSHAVVRRKTPNHIHVGQPANIQWQVTNTGSQAIFRLQIIDSIKQVFSRLGEVKKNKRKKRNVTAGIISYRKIPAEQTDYSSFRILFSERGTYELGPTTVACRFPLALVNSWFRTQQIERIYVAPQLGNLAADWHKIFSTRDQGAATKSNYKGIQEEEFFAIREWRSGDNKKKIHWRSAARKRQPMVKQYDRISEEHRAIVVDLFADPAATEDFLRRVTLCEQALSFVASALAQWSETVKGNLFVGINAEKPVCYSSVQHVEFARQCMQALSCTQYSTGDSLNETISEVINCGNQNTPCLVISSRDWSEVVGIIRPEFMGQIRWLNVQSREFTRIFQSAAKAENFVDDLQFQGVS